MFNLSEYRRKPDRLADLLPWAALIAPGVVLNKDGSFLAVIAYRGSDLESSTPAQLVSMTARLNNLLKRLGSGWVIHVEARRQTYSDYPETDHFPDPISWFIDAERREMFSSPESNFESRYFFSVQYLPPAETQSKLQNAFIKNSGQSNSAYGKQLDFFTSTVNRLLDIMSDFMYETALLNDDEVLTYLHSTISTKQHAIKTPETPMYLDTLLADTPLLGGLEPRLGDKHLAMLSLRSFPSTTLPALFDQLNNLPLCYRWCTRFIPLDKTEAETQLKSYKRQWFAKRKSLLHIVQEMMTKNESQLIDNTAVDKARDADEALQALADDYVAFGYYTTTIVVTGDTREQANTAIREIEHVINGLGFTTIIETFNAVEAWLSTLPGQAYANVRAPLLHTLNLAHLFPFSAVWSGQESNQHLNAAPLFFAYTHGQTPFRYVHHIGDVGHQLVLGPTGAGKSVLLNFMALQFRRYQNASVFIFDKGGSFLASTAGVNGDYFQLGQQQTTDKLAFQPLAAIDDDQERVWASEWLQSLLINEQITITPKIKQALWDALQLLSHLPKRQRTLTGLYTLVQQADIRHGLLPYTLDGSYGYLLDADNDIDSDANWQCYEMEKLMATPSIIAPVLMYLFHRLEKHFQGQPVLLILDEAWLFLDNPIFAAKIRDWLKTLRKHNVSVVFATQSVSDAMNCSIAPALLESCAGRILLPHDRVLEPKIRADYEKLGLNEKQLNILASATPKRQYYYQSRLGNRLFDLGLGPIALAFCAAASPAERQQLNQWQQQFDYYPFLQEYLQQHGLSSIWQAISEQQSNTAASEAMHEKTKTEQTTNA